MTNAELIIEARKPGRVELPIASEHDVFKIECVKADLISFLEGLRRNEQAPWYICDTRTAADGKTIRSLDVQNEI